MQTPKARTGLSDMHQRTSPSTPRSARQPKAINSTETDSSSSVKTRTSTDRSPKVYERKSPRSPVAEKKRPSRLTELETQLSQVQDELKKAKEQLSASETWKSQAEQEAEESKKQLADLAAKFDDSQQQLLDLTASEVTRLQELCKISQERDHACESELEALQKQHSIDSAALSTALNEIQNLKIQLEAAAEEEATHARETEMAHTELQAIKQEMSDMLSLVEDVKMQLKDSKESETQAHSVVKEALLELEAAKSTIELLQFDRLQALASFNSVSKDLKESQGHATSLEEMITQLRSDLVGARDSKEVGELSDLSGQPDKQKSAVDFLKLEIKQLKFTLEEMELKYQEEKTQTTLEMQSAYELAKTAKSDSNHRESELEAELRREKEDVSDLKAHLMDKETELQAVAAENEGLHEQMRKENQYKEHNQHENELEKTKAAIVELNALLLNKEAQLCSVMELNEKLRTNMQQRDLEKKLGNADAETAKAAEREAIAKLQCLGEELDKSTRRASRVAEQLEAANAANSEMEAELNRLRIQSDQWRKAAEAAASVLADNHTNGKLMKRSGSLDNVDFNPTMVGKMMYSPFSEDMDDDSPKKKYSVLKKFGGLWRKGQK